MALLTYIILIGFLNITLGKDCLINEVPAKIAYEVQLIKDLKCDYRIFDPPSGNSSTFTVNFVFIMKYFNFNSNEDVFTVQNWMVVSWRDDRLKWDPEKYDGIKETELSSMTLWTPELRLFNSADSDDFDIYFYVKCKVKSNGNVFCLPRLTHAAVCNAKLTNWPYDVQECSLEFGARPSKWVNFKINVSSRAISMLGAEYGAEWFMSDYKQEVNTSSERQLKMIFVLEREATGLVAVIVYPSLILTALSITALFLDVRLNFRLGVACFSLLGHYYFLSVLGLNLPQGSLDPPNILLYYRGSVILTVSIMLSTFVIASMCRLKSRPPHYIISINDLVYESCGRYLVFPRWHFDDVMIDNKRFSHDWTKFANMVNNVFGVVIIIVYSSLYSSLMPKPAPVNY